ncbi:MAG: hypothetical protein J6Z31_00440 [Fibrobacter sp.]|nr:hypothetical protein [Fibrobacter sp.]
MQKTLSEAVFENLKELIKGKNAAHESMFKFHWKKLWPFSLIFPQVDFIRIQRFMGEIKEQALGQKTFIQNNLSKSVPDEKDFLKAVPAYIDALAVSCEKLATIAKFKQDILEKKQKRDVFAFNRLLTEYQNAQADLIRAGAFVQVAWGELASKSSAKNAGQTESP